MSVRFHRILSVVCLVLSLLSTARAQQLPPPATQPAANKRILVDFNVDDSIDKAIARLKEADPDFRVLLIRDAGAAPGQPHVNLVLKNVGAEDVLNVIASVYPDLLLRKIEGSTGTINVLRIVHELPRNQNLFGGEADEGVKVYNLTPVVDMWIRNNLPPAFKDEDMAAMRKKALDQILSLVQAALNQTPSDASKPVLQVHEPTQTLVFRGTPPQRHALEEAMKALQTDKPGQTAAAKIEEELRALRAQLDRQEAELARIRDLIGRNTEPARKP